MLELNTREVSILIWSVIALLLMVAQPSLREGFSRILKTVFSRQLIVFFALVLLYCTGTVYLLHWVGVWEPTHLKVTLLWVAMTGITSAGRGITSYDDGPAYWQPVRDSLRLVVLLELVVGLATFNLLIELILVPFATILAVLATYAEIRHQGEPVHRFLGRLQVLFGLSIVAVGTARLVGQYPNGLEAAAFVEFWLPALLSLLFIPAVFLSLVYGRYEWLFLKVKGSWTFRLYAKFRLFFQLGFRPAQVLSFGRQHMFALPGIRTRKELQHLLSRRTSGPLPSS